MISIFAYAFMIGVIASANPCGFALLPAYLARRLGTDSADDGNRLDAVGRAIVVGAAATAGFLLIFGLAGGAIALGGHWLFRMLPWAGFVIGVALAATGLAVVMGWQIKVRLPVLGPAAVGSGLSGDFLFGVGYGAASLSCTLPLFLAVTGAALTGGLLWSAFNFAAYALGMGTVLMSLAVAAALARRGLAATLGRLGKYVHRASGAVLFIAGLYVIYYWGVPIFSPGMAGENSVIQYGEVLANGLNGWFNGTVGRNTVFTLSALLAAMTVWIVLRRIAALFRNEHRGFRSPEQRREDANIGT